jgi:hypothetical protein
MPIIRSQDNLDFTYAMHGKGDAELVNEYFDIMYHDYETYGDAMGRIIDIRNVTTASISGLKQYELRMRGVVSEFPTVIVIKPSFEVAISFLRVFGTLSGRGEGRYKFFDNIEDATNWLHNWFDERGLDREQLRGQKTMNFMPSPQQNLPV